MMGWSNGKMGPISRLIRQEARTLSRVWRGDFADGDLYRSTAELYADFMSALFNDPDWTMRTAPQMTHAFFAALSEAGRGNGLQRPARAAENEPADGVLAKDRS